MQEQKLCCESLCAIDHLILGVSPNPKCTLTALLLNQEQCELHPSMPGKNVPPPVITVTHQPWQQVCLINPIILCHYACGLTQAPIETHADKHKKILSACVYYWPVCLMLRFLYFVFHYSSTALTQHIFFLLSVLLTPWPLIYHLVCTHIHISFFCFCFFRSMFYLSNS